MTNGQMGAIPDTYLVMRAADRLNCTVWDLLERDDYVYWLNWALTVDAAESDARKGATVERR